MMEECEGGLAFNLEETKKISEKPIYKKYKEWLRENGVIIDPNIIYPAFFGQKGKGVIGVATEKLLPAKKAIIAVPYDLIITVDKVKAIDQLNKIIKDNPNLFKFSDESAFGILSLYVCYEMVKKEKSFYDPYFAVADDISLTNWTHWEMLAIENAEVIRLLKHQKEEIEKSFMTFLTVIRRNPHIFPEQLTNTQYKTIFEKAYNFICTRAFGWSLPSISLIPMADSLNHNNEYVNHMLIDTKLQLEPHENYTPKYKKINLSLLNSISQPKLPDLQPPRKQKTKRLKFIQKHKQILDKEEPAQSQGKKAEQQHHQILYQQYLAEVRNMRQLHFYEDSCSQDNDTDDEVIEDYEYNMERLKFYEKYESPGLTDKTKKQALTKYWQMFLDPTFWDQCEEEEEQLQKNKEVPSKEKLESGQKDSQASQPVSSTSSSSDDDYEQFRWMTSNPESHNHKSTYFIMSTRKKTEKHQELYNFYGRRSNRFLLVGYNFILDENKYDSFAFRILVDVGGKKSIFSKTTVPSLIYRNTGTYAKQPFSKQLRVKDERVCLTLINHCRALLIGWTDKIEQKGKAKIITPFSLEFESSVLTLAEEFIKCLRKQFMTSLDEDEQLLQKCHKHEMRMAIKMRMGYKQILEGQQKILKKCQEYVKMWKKGRLVLPQGKQSQEMKWVGRSRVYLNSLERGGL